ncbi:d-ribulose-5-phosphate 3 epimerase [Mycoplasmopsis californica]|uniref:Ribulose-phosphate 3-epimerase n=1 Tax=Mycoplasmopsis equigenitalium TaxID=114883 RepID=A0ABY5J5K5_9BACT|nr:ribulose-phosphate 3-epimerase [Mycoplasmopsis equigenitalium]UUD37161.1 ribulose-phosphate 3-epimerase [Mycoplasmopsis equigenitalium]VEU69533.1 d-ribulose-5-phosphate 3 epimerase [Mycoplasmopsis californica]
MRWKHISPSILDVKQEYRAAFVNDLITNKNIKWIHYDVMDGEFVPNTAISLEEIKAIKEASPDHFCDAHLMIVNPLDQVEKFAKYVSTVTFHYEAIEEIDLALFINRYSHDFSIGLAINPDTPVDDIVPFLEFLDIVLVMSVWPGKGGQKFIETSLDKIKELKRLRALKNYHYLIQVDGGINKDTAKLAWKAGADLLVAGSYIVKDPSQENIDSISFENRLKKN